MWLNILGIEIFIEYVVDWFLVVVWMVILVLEKCIYKVMMLNRINVIVIFVRLVLKMKIGVLKVLKWIGIFGIRWGMDVVFVV